MALHSILKKAATSTRSAGVFAAAMGLLTASGCVSMEQYRALQMQDNQHREAAASAESEARTARAETDAYKKQIADLMAGRQGSEALSSNYQNQLAQLQAANAELQAKYDEAIRRVGEAGATPLPAQLNSELSKFAEQNPDLVDFDQSRGMVKFKSDVTFAVGDAELTDKARSAIDRFAQILNSPAASNYELLVAGHTDSTPVSNPATLAKGHKNNWFLSAHRAISVVSALTHDGIAPGRLGAVGYADQRPIASNATNEGKAQNRRVEVLILPTTVHNTVANTGTAAAQPAAGRVTPPHHNKDDNKDSVPAVPHDNK